MSVMRTRVWRQLCRQAADELEPQRRMAIVGKLSRILRKDVYQFGPLSIDIGQMEVKRNDQSVSLTNLEFRLLRHLVERAGSTVSRDELLRLVWGYDPKTFTRTVDVHVHSLRRKIEQNAKHPTLIVTVPGKGYKFVPR